MHLYISRELDEIFISTTSAKLFLIVSMSLRYYWEFFEQFNWFFFQELKIVIIPLSN